ncbi:MAG TPA: response regulator transcription factor [Anaerolineae bacterium]|jgi:DNA-binding response OmpR family regulator|nr:response regulator transcription factor [Anaerolineae bacterium]
MIQILVIEDDPLIRETLEYSLKGAGFNVSTAEDGAQGLVKLKENGPDLILLDLLLPEMDGFEVCGKIRKVDDNVPIIMITALEDQRSKLKGFSIGADDYITKPFSIEELIARIRANLKRTLKKVGGPPILEIGDLRLDLTKHTVEVAGKEVHLRLKEFQLLTVLASEPDLLFTRQDLAERVWGSEFYSSSRTIDVHIRRIRNKIEEHSNFSYIQTVHGLGYKFQAGEKVACE